jgi:hypothetical protein
MNIYHYITNQYLNSLENKLEVIKDYEHLTSLYKIYLSFYYNETQNKLTDKYYFLHNFLHNSLLTKEIKDRFFGFFQKIQKIYFCFVKLSYIFKYKRAKITVTYDLTLNSISEKERNIIVIYQNNNKYLFHIKELLQIIGTNLIHSEYFFVKPLVSKNPYNNITFSNAILYNIYFFMKYQTNYTSELFYHFFLCDFELSIFRNKNESLLRNYVIEDFIKNERNQSLVSIIHDMLDEYNKKSQKCCITPHDDFPDKKLIEIMKPYLQLYLISKYSLVITEKRNAHKMLFKKLERFYHYNPQFGRKNIKLVKINENEKKAKYSINTFMEEHILFHEKNDEIFWNSYHFVKMV